jgi:hypothetical protein
MRAALQHRVPGVPGDLGWKTSTEITLSPSATNFHVVWNGSLALPAGSHRILVTESETYLRSDVIPGDPNVSTSPLDFVRERVVRGCVRAIAAPPGARPRRGQSVFRQARAAPGTRASPARRGGAGYRYVGMWIMSTP